MTENIRVYLCDMPIDIKGYTVKKDDFYTIVINEKLCWSTRMKVYQHELSHIMNGDFDRKIDPDLIEVIARRRTS